MATWDQPLANALEAQKVVEAQSEAPLNRLARQVQQTQLRDWLRDKEVQKMVAAGMVAPGSVMPGSTDQPVNQLAPPPQAAPTAAAANLLAPKPPTVQGGVGAGVAMPTSPMAVEQPAAPAAPQAPAQQPSMLQRQLAVYQQMKADGKIEDYEYGKLVTDAITASNAKAAADLEQFGKLTEMVKKAGGPAKFGALVSSGMFDGIAPPETLAKLKQIDYSKMKEEPDFTEYELPSGGRLVSGRDADGKPYTHVMPADKSLSAEQLTAKSLEEKLGRKPTATEIKTEMDAGKSKTPEQLRGVFTDMKQPPEVRDKAWNDFKLAPLTTNQLTAIATDKTLPEEYRKFAQGVMDKEDKRKANMTKLVVEVKQDAKDASEKKKEAKSGPLIDRFARAIINGQMAPSQIKTFKGAEVYQRTLARVLEMQPDFSLSKAEREYKLAGNPEFQKRQLVLEALPETISNVVAAGKKLDNKYGVLSAAKMASIIKKEGQSEDMRDFITLRNDAVLELAYAMRMAGMSEGATALEQQGVNENMAPREFDAWRRAQYKAILPRMQRTFAKTGEGLDVIQYMEKEMYGKVRTQNRPGRAASPPAGKSSGKVGKYTYTVE